MLRRDKIQITSVFFFAVVNPRKLTLVLVSKEHIAHLYKLEIFLSINFNNFAIDKFLATESFFFQLPRYSALTHQNGSVAKLSSTVWQDATDQPDSPTIHLRREESCLCTAEGEKKKKKNKRQNPKYFIHEKKNCRRQEKGWSNTTSIIIDDDRL